jgi:hypothetical protein
MRIENEDCDSVATLNIMVDWMKTKHPTFQIINIETLKNACGTNFYRMWYSIDYNK